MNNAFFFTSPGNRDRYDCVQDGTTTLTISTVTLDVRLIPQREESCGLVQGFDVESEGTGAYPFFLSQTTNLIMKTSL